jgi:hypothetical protein
VPALRSVMPREPKATLRRWMLVRGLSNGLLATVSTSTSPTCIRRNMRPGE